MGVVSRARSRSIRSTATNSATTLHSATPAAHAVRTPRAKSDVPDEPSQADTIPTTMPAYKIAGSVARTSVPAIDASGRARNAAGATMAEKNTAAPSHALSSIAATIGAVFARLTLHPRCAQCR